MVPPRPLCTGWPLKTLGPQARPSQAIADVGVEPGRDRLHPLPPQMTAVDMHRVAGEGLDEVEEETGVDGVNRDAAWAVREDRLARMDDRPDTALQPYLFACLTQGRLVHPLALVD